MVALIPMMVAWELAKSVCESKPTEKAKATAARPDAMPLHPTQRREMQKACCASNDNNRFNQMSLSTAALKGLQQQQQSVACKSISCDEGDQKCFLKVE